MGGRRPLAPFLISPLSSPFPSPFRVWGRFCRRALFLPPPFTPAARCLTNISHTLGLPRMPPLSPFSSSGFPTKVHKVDMFLRWGSAGAKATRRSDACAGTREDGRKGSPPLVAAAISLLPSTLQTSQVPFRVRGERGDGLQQQSEGREDYHREVRGGGRPPLLFRYVSSSPPSLPPSRPQARASSPDLPFSPLASPHTTTPTPSTFAHMPWGVENRRVG